MARLRCMTFNTGLAPLVSEEKAVRARALLDRVTHLQLDVLGLQEVYCEESLRFLVSAEGLPRAGLPHIAHFISGCNLPATSHGSGLLVASRHPITETFFHSFSAGGDITSLEFDNQAGKGVGLARLALPGGRAADVYVSHLQAQYADAPRDRYAAQRALQAFETAEVIRSTRRAPLTVLLVDLNAGPAALPYRAVAELCELCDAYSAHSPRGTVRAITDSTFGRVENVYSHAYRASAASEADRNWRAVMGVRTNPGLITDTPMPSACKSR